MKGNLFSPLIAAGVASVFCLETKGTKSSRKNDASTAQGKTPGPPFFHPTARIFCFIVHPPTATYRALILCFGMIIELTPCPMPRKTFMKVKPNHFYPPRLHRPLITVPPALTGAAITVLALAEPFIAAGAAVGFLVLFSYRKRTRPPRL
jgi:hypothetical protein